MSDPQIPPHSLEAEAGALGCCLLDGNLGGQLNLEWFHDFRHRALSGEILAMLADGQPVSAETVCERLNRTGKLAECGGLEYIAGLPGKTAHAGMIEHWAGILRGLSAIRLGIEAARNFMVEAHTPDADPQDVIAQFQGEVMSLSASTGAGATPIKALVLGAIDELERAVQHRGQPDSILTGFHDFDRMTCGLRPGQVVIIAARPSVGKTSLAMNIAEHVAVDARLPVGVFSLEMSGPELAFRMICSRARVSSLKAKQGELNEREIARMTGAGSEIAKAPLHILDRAGLTIGELSADARQLQQQHGIQLLIVDYLGLVGGGQKKYETRNVEVGLVSVGLKNLARQIGVPLIACCQLNRDVEKSERTPRLADLRDSGSIEQDADIVAFLHKGQDTTRDEAQPVKLIIAKHRSGPQGEIDLVFFKPCTRFESAACP